MRMNVPNLPNMPGGWGTKRWATPYTTPSNASGPYMPIMASGLNERQQQGIRMNTEAEALRNRDETANTLKNQYAATLNPDSFPISTPVADAQPAKGYSYTGATGTGSQLPTLAQAQQTAREQAIAQYAKTQLPLSPVYQAANQQYQDARYARANMVPIQQWQQGQNAVNLGGAEAEMAKRMAERYGQMTPSAVQQQVLQNQGQEYDNRGILQGIEQRDKMFPGQLESQRLHNQGLGIANRSTESQIEPNVQVTQGKAAELQSKAAQGNAAAKGMIPPEKHQAELSKRDKAIEQLQKQIASMTAQLSKKSGTSNVLGGSQEVPAQISAPQTEQNASGSNFTINHPTTGEPISATQLPDGTIQFKDGSRVRVLPDGRYEKVKI